MELFFQSYLSSYLYYPYLFYDTKNLWFWQEFFRVDFFGVFDIMGSVLCACGGIGRHATLRW